MTTNQTEIDALLASPALAAPEGVTPNFVDPPNQNGLAYGVLSICLVLSTICFALRVYAKVFMLRKVQAEEILVICAFGIFIGQMYLGYALVDVPGYFVHQYDMTYSDVVVVEYNILVMGCLYQTVLPLLKVAILTEWIRLFAPPGNRIKSPFWLGCVFVSVVQVLWGIGCVIALNLQCTPHEAIWKIWLPSKCFALYNLQLASGAVQLFCDVLMLVLPQRIIWGLQLDLKKKLGVSVVFGLGVLACVSAAMRLSVTVTFGTTDDQLYNLGPLVFWVDAESTCAFFIACVPCLPKILRETGALRRIKKAFGMKVSNPGSSYGVDNKAAKYGYGTKYSAGVTALSSRGAPDSYRKLDEESGMGLDDMRADSTERLRKPASSSGKIMRTTQVTIHRAPDENYEPPVTTPGIAGSKNSSSQESWLK
ncbi:hypothetical protein GGR56DRAFT_134946 [Xylariaceae sp. FL0804]|nr:hypothetical protein GGR56DRAFT_134946 [Xylariaceae sp. FL0804]